MNNQTAFYKACRNGNIVKVEALLNKKKFLFFKDVLADEPEVET